MTASGWLEEQTPPRREEWKILSSLAPKRSVKKTPDVVNKRQHKSESYDPLEAGIAVMESACASPTPDDATWPGGWRGIDAFREDIERLASVGLPLYESVRYPPTDRIERAIEALAAHVVRGRHGQPSPDELPDATGWRHGDSALGHTTVCCATEALRELAVGAWRVGFGWRALLTIRRLNAIFVLTVRAGNTKAAEDIARDVGKAVRDAAQWSGDTLAAKERGRQLILSLAPELKTLAQAGQPHTDDGLWACVFKLLDAIRYAPKGNVIEASTEVYLYFLSGVSSVPEPDDGRFQEPRPLRSPRELTNQVRKHLLYQLCWATINDEPGMGLTCVLALWSDALIGEGHEHLDDFKRALESYVLCYERRDFSPSERWARANIAGDVSPRELRVHWRFFDVARAAHDWLDATLAGNESPQPVLPLVTTPDSDLRALIEEFGVRELVDERHYWGIALGHGWIVCVEEADNSRRLLRDRECRARAEFAWGYDGTGPHLLSEALVGDVLGALIYCPSCFGAIPVSGGLITCPCCMDGLRRDLETLQEACVTIIARFPKKPQPSLVSADAPPGAQWHLTRTDLLSRLLRDPASSVVDGR